MEHADLILEMAHIEHMSTQERLLLARRRRIQQLKSWFQREKEWLRQQKNNRNSNDKLNSRSFKRNITFSDNVMLLEAASRNDIDEVRRLLEKEVSPCATNEDGLTALHQCCIDDNEEMMKLLIEFGADVNAEDSEKWTDYTKVKIIQKKRLLNSTLKIWNPVHHFLPSFSSERSYKKMLKRIERLEKSCTLKDLMIIVRFVITEANIKSAQAKQIIEDGYPLHAAATCGHVHLVRYLIDSGANLLAVNADGNMPYDICEDEETLDFIENEMARRGVTQELIDETRANTEMRMLRDLEEAVAQGHDIECGDAEQNATPLHIAAANGYIRVVEFLLDNHVCIDVRDADDWQLEILEMLVQNGADLNARTKHDETPADICEDPELRERIMQLRCEQESKRIQEAQRRRVKRTQSNNNTRTQSVRRTSIREKTLTSKKDAVEEARLRLQAQDVDMVDSKTSESQVDLSLEYELHQLEAERLFDHSSTARREPEGKDDDSMNLLNSSSLDANKMMQLDLPTETTYSTGDNGKINIHVSVTINASTLAELKKQRAQHRNSSPDIALHPIPHHQQQQLAVPSNEHNADQEMSTVKRFAGNTGDQLVGDPKTTRCCVLL